LTGGIIVSLCQCSDITRDDFNKNMVISVSVWVQDMSRNGGSFLGVVYVPIVPLFNQATVLQSFPLRASDGSEGSVRGKLQISLAFTSITSVRSLSFSLSPSKMVNSDLCRLFSSQQERKVGYDDFEWLRLIGKGNFGKVP